MCFPLLIPLCLLSCLSPCLSLRLSRGSRREKTTGREKHWLQRAQENLETVRVAEVVIAVLSVTLGVIILTALFRVVRHGI